MIGTDAEIPYSVEVKRKLIHLSSLWIPLAIWFLPRKTVILILAVALVGSLALDLFRHFSSLQLKWWREVAALFRPKETGKLSGSSFLLLAAVLMVFFFPREIAVLSLLYLLVGDLAAALVGRKIGKHKIGTKSLEGSLAFLLAAAVVSFLVPNLPTANKLLAASVAAAVEILPLSLDDNLTVPIATGGFLLLIG